LHIHQAHDKYVKQKKGTLSVQAFRQRIFDLGVEKGFQGLTDEAIRTANEQVRPQSKSIMVAIKSVEINKKFQNFIRSARLADKKAAAAILFYAGLKEWLETTEAADHEGSATFSRNWSGKSEKEGEGMATSNVDPFSGRPGVDIAVEVMSREEALATFNYRAPPPPRGKSIKGEQLKSLLRNLIESRDSTPLAEIAETQLVDEPHAPKEPNVKKEELKSLLRKVMTI
jgi:hypothetical protein